MSWLPESVRAWLLRAVTGHARLSRTANSVARRLAGRHRVGALGIVFDDAGRVLVARHVTRGQGWSLPGGWVDPFEEPSHAVVRELSEELGVDVEAVELVACESHGPRSRALWPPPSGITLVFRCRPSTPAAVALDRLSPELADAAWREPDDVIADMSAFEASVVSAVVAGRPGPTGSVAPARINPP